MNDVSAVSGTSETRDWINSVVFPCHQVIKLVMFLVLGDVDAMLDSTTSALPSPSLAGSLFSYTDVVSGGNAEFVALYHALYFRCCTCVAAT
jgi:hypothetical protein